MLHNHQLKHFAQAASQIDESPIMVVDVSILQDQCRVFRELFPDITLTYALKCFPDAAVVAAIEDLVDGYDVASVKEIEMLLGAGVKPGQLSYSNPVKQDIAIQQAFTLGVLRFAYQSEAELAKIAQNAPGSSVYLRLDVSSAKGSLDFSSKFGADYNDAVDLLVKAKELDLTVLGVTFHVGSQAQDIAAWKAAIARAAEVMRRTKAVGLTQTELNIGGGFPVIYKPGDLSINDLAMAVNAELAQLKQEFPEIQRIIAEPGRFLTADCAAIVATIIGKETRGGKPWLYLDTGTFQSFIEIFEFNDFMYPVYSMKHIGVDSSETQEYALTGPTCHGVV